MDRKPTTRHFRVAFFVGRKLQSRRRMARIAALEIENLIGCHAVKSPLVAVAFVYDVLLDSDVGGLPRLKEKLVGVHIGNEDGVKAVVI